MEWCSNGLERPNILGGNSLRQRFLFTVPVNTFHLHSYSTPFQMQDWVTEKCVCMNSDWKSHGSILSASTYKASTYKDCLICISYKIYSQMCRKSRVKYALIIFIHWKHTETHTETLNTLKLGSLYIANHGKEMNSKTTRRTSYKKEFPTKEYKNPELSWFPFTFSYYNRLYYPSALLTAGWRLWASLWEPSNWILTTGLP